MLSPSILVADVLDSSPLVVRLLLELRVGCLGCFLNKFCTLEDLCDRHGLDLDQVMVQVREQLDKTTK